MHIQSIHIDNHKRNENKAIRKYSYSERKVQCGET